MDELEATYPEQIHPLLEEMGQHMLNDYEYRILDELVETNVTTERVRSHFVK